MEKIKKKILIMVGYYIPSVKGGGPIQSIKNLVNRLSSEFDFYIVASDRDLGDKKPFNDIQADEWVAVGNARVFYTNKKLFSWKKIKDLLNSIDYDFLYLNSFFSYRDSIIPIILNKMNHISSKPIIIAPRGQFYKGAIKFKNLKKIIYIKFSKIFNLMENITWHSTDNTETKIIKDIYGQKANIIKAGNLTVNSSNIIYDKNLPKNKGELKIIFISRIHPKKNLKNAIKLMKYIKGKIEFNIYGPIENNSYWLKCQEAINCLPPNIKVCYKGIAKQDTVIDIFKKHHVFLFPTLGENFGHIIAEALIGGCPVIISDQTPWRDLEQKMIGWDINLNDKDKFISVLQYCVYLENQEYNLLSRNAFKYIKNNSNREIDIKKYHILFNE